MTGVELAANWLFGYVDEVPAAAPPLRRPSGDRAGPVRALDEAILVAWAPRTSEPLFVAFSGGRDSSVVLARSLAVSRREGLPPPVPITYRYSGDERADESEWQELVVGHLGVREWVKIEGGPELDLVGPVAAPSLRRLGVVWPPTVHRHRALFREARGTLLDGEGGDEVFGRQRASAIGYLRAGRRSLSPARARRIAYALMPSALRRRRLEGAAGRGLDWLRADARREFACRIAEDMARLPFRWDRAMPRQQRRRASVVGARNIGAIAAEEGCTVGHPLQSPAFVTALAAHFGPFGPVSRAAALEQLFSDDLPRAVLRRATKASFNGVFFREHSREFARRWDGTGVDLEIVDAAQLARAWSQPVVHAQTFALLQQAWLASERDGR